MRYSVLLSNNNRSKAYLQNLVSHGYPPAQAIVLDAGGALRPENTQRDTARRNGSRPIVRASKDAGIGFDENEHVLDTIETNGTNHIVLDTMDVNSEEVVSTVARAQGDYVLYSGPGGTILRRKILGLGKEFIHVHPGWLPEYRGSTTAYYSLLVNKTVSCSVFFMRAGIDKGPILYRRRFDITEADIDYDYVLDPCVRAATLLDFFRNSDELISHPLDQGRAEGDTFYIIHPVLKHMAILSMKGTDGRARDGAC